MRNIEPETLAREASLLEALSAGDSSAFWPLWQAHAERLMSVCLYDMNGNYADAQDALSDAMLRAFDKMPASAGRIVQVEPWLIRLTRNVCRDIHRRRARGSRAAADLQVRGDESVPAGEAPKTVMDVSEEHLASLIERLPERLREVLLLRAVRNMPYNDIAEKLHLTPANARKRVQQARAALRLMLHDEFTNGPDPRL